MSHGSEREAEIIPAVIRRMVHDLRESPGSERPAFAARNLSMALRDGRLKGADKLNRVLAPFLPRLYLIAARGHWLSEHRPIRRDRKPWETLEVPPPDATMVHVGQFDLCSVVSQEGELHMLLSLKSHRVTYSLGPYPQLREFQAMVEKLAESTTWNGRHFFGHTDTLLPPHKQKEGGVTKYYFREHSKGVLVELSPAELAEVKELFRQGMNLPELKPTMTELSLQYGEF